MPFSRSASRCSTPKRCCSSTTTSARSANWTCFWMRAWVPTTMPASPEAASSRDRRRAAVALAPGEQRHRGAELGAAEHPARARSPSIAVIDRWCWAASTSVGASSAAWPPASTAGEHRPQRDDRLARPDLALQQPVHRPPRRARFASTSPISRCPSVSSKGSRASKAASSPPGRGGRGVASSDSAALRRCARIVCSTKASSYFSRSRPRSGWSSTAGRCTSSSATARSTRPRASRTGSGTGSRIRSTESSAVWTSFAAAAS